MNLLWQQIQSPLITEILTLNTSFDGVVLDAEHGFFSPEGLLHCIRAVKKNKLVFVRLPSIDKTLVSYTLDAGAHGIIFANVQSSHEVSKIIECAFFPPKGKRGLGFAPYNHWGELLDLGIEKSPILIPQLESVEAVNNIRDLVNDVFRFYLIGPYDLSLSLGCPGNYKSHLFRDALRRLSESLPDFKLGVHLPKIDADQTDQFRDFGLRCHGMDTTYLARYAKFPTV